MYLIKILIQRLLIIIDTTVVHNSSSNLNVLQLAKKLCVLWEIKFLTVSIIVQRDATQSSLFIILQVHSTCFGCQPHSTPGVHKTVTTAFGTSHIFLCSYLPPPWPS